MAWHGWRGDEIGLAEESEMRARKPRRVSEVVNTTTRSHTKPLHLPNLLLSNVVLQPYLFLSDPISKPSSILECLFLSHPFSSSLHDILAIHRSLDRDSSSARLSESRCYGSRISDEGLSGGGGVGIVHGMADRGEAEKGVET